MRALIVLVLLLLCCVLIPGPSESFVAKGLFGWGIFNFWTTRSHDYLSRSAVCIAQHKWLADNKGLNAPEPNANGDVDKACPYKAWDNELKTSFRKSAKSVAEEIVGDAYQPDMQASMRDNPSFHFDSDSHMYFTNRRLTAQRALIIKSIRELQPGSSVDIIHREIGYYLHTLQDFYSHTNWVESGMTSPNDDIGSRDFSTPVAPYTLATCLNCTREFTAAQEAILRSFYLEPGSFAYELWKGWKAGNVYICHDNLVHTGYLTSGYYGTEDFLAPKPRSIMKCSHGGGKDDSARTSATGGMNKDSDTFLYSPHYYLHAQAALLAVQASVQFLQAVRSAVANDVKFGRVLGFDAPKTVGILMDTTGSMDDSIAAAIAWAKSIVEQAASGATADSLYYLTPFNDPDYGPVMVFRDPKQMLAALDTMSAGGGGDTPEMCFPALYETVMACPERTKLFVFTDAPSKHGELAARIRAEALQNTISISFLMSGGVLKKEKSHNIFATKSLLQRVPRRKIKCTEISQCPAWESSKRSK